MKRYWQLHGRGEESEIPGCRRRGEATKSTNTDRKKDENREITSQRYCRNFEKELGGIEHDEVDNANRSVD